MRDSITARLRRIRDFLEYERRTHKDSENHAEVQEINELLADLKEIGGAIRNKCEPCACKAANQGEE